MEKVPLCRDVAASAFSFGLVLAQIKELVSRIQGLLDQIVDVPVPKVTGEIPVFVGVWEEIVDAIQLVPQEQVFEECVQNRVLEQIMDSPVPQLMEAVVEVIPQEQVQNRTLEQTVGFPVPQITEEIVENRFPEQFVDVPVRQIMEAIVVDRFPEQLVDVPVPQIMEAIVVDRFPEQIVDVPVPQLMEAIVERGSLSMIPPCLRSWTKLWVPPCLRSRRKSWRRCSLCMIPPCLRSWRKSWRVQLVDVGSPVPQITEKFLDSVPLEDVGSVVPLSNALIPHVTEFADEVRDTPLQRIWCIFEEVGSASVEQIVDVSVPQDTEIIGGVQVNEEFRGWRVVWQHSPG